MSDTATTPTTPMSFSQASLQLADADKNVDIARKNLERNPCDYLRDKYNEAMTAYEQAYADYSLAKRAQEIDPKICPQCGLTHNNKATMYCEKCVTMLFEEDQREWERQEMKDERENG